MWLFIALWLPLSLAVVPPDRGDDDADGVIAQEPGPGGQPAAATGLRGYREGVDFNRSLHAAAFSRDGAEVVTAGSDRVIRVWDADTGEQRAAIREPDGLSMAWGASLDPRRRWVAACGPWMRTRAGPNPGWQGGILRIWDLGETWDAGRHVELLRFASSRFINAVSVGKDGRFVSMLDDRGCFLVIDTFGDLVARVEPTITLSPAEETRDPPPACRPGQEMGFSDDGHRAVATASLADGGGGAFFYDAHRRTVRLERDATLAAAAGVALPGEGYGVRKAVISPDGSLVAIRFNPHRNRAFLIEFDAPRLVRAFTMDDADEIEHLAIDPDNRSLALGTAIGDVRVLEIATGRRLASREAAGLGPIRALRFLGDRLRLLSGAGARAEGPPPEPGGGVDPGGLHVWDVLLPGDGRAVPE